MNNHPRGRQDPIVALVETALHAPQHHPSGPPHTERRGLKRGLAHTAHQYRVELVALAALTALALYIKNGPPLISLPLTATLIITLTLTRKHVHRLFHNARLRRHWHHATHHTNLQNTRIRKIKPCNAGDRLTIRIAPGQSIQHIAAKTDELAAALHARTTRVQRDENDASKATLTIERHDPFDKLPPTPWPGLNPDNTPSVWEPTQIGTTEDSHPLTLKIVGNQILVGGITGGGKSVILRSLLGTAALDPNARIWLFDAKRLELAPWAPAAEQFVGRDGPKAVETLTHLLAIATARQREIEATGADKIRRSSNLPVHVIVVDELGEYAALDEGDQIMTLLTSLMSQGRALGITGIIATQYPHSSIIKTTLRGQCKTRIVTRVADRHQGETVTGDIETAKLAAQIPARLPGVAYAYDETGRAVRFRSVALLRPDDEDPDREDDVLRIVERATGDRLTRDFAELTGVPDVTSESAHTPTGYVERAVPATPAPAVKTGKKTPGVNGKPRKTRTPELMQPIMDAWDGEPLTQSGLARLVGRKPTDGSVRRAVTALEKQGFIVRNEDGLWVKTTK